MATAPTAAQAAQIVADQIAITTAQNAVSAAQAALNTAPGTPALVNALSLAQTNLTNANAQLATDNAAINGTASWVYWTVGGVALIGTVLLVHHYDRKARPNRRRHRR
jgi:hypothetical protein